ncbi:MAG TPA: methyltransferase domain-containing protein, partial [Vicinamibacterales bacterium]|nr:methyltransferase domain-containing protein [Vicinamibacterales bacterium]
PRGAAMSAWDEHDSEIFRAIADVAVPRRDEMIAALVAAVPASPDKAIRILDLGCGDAILAEGLLTRFPRAALTALDGSASMRLAAARRLARFGERASVAPFDLASLDWWDRMFGADLIVSSMCLHHLNDAKKQYLYKAAADRLSPTGALLIADLVEPQHPAPRRVAADRWDQLARRQADALDAPQRLQQFHDAHWNHFRFPDPDDQPSALLHHLVWLRHAGFASVDCVWLDAGHAVFGGFKQAGASAPPLQADS